MGVNLDEKNWQEETLPEGTILGKGTPEDPLQPPIKYRLDGTPRRWPKFPPKVCPDCSLHYYPMTSKQKKCHFCIAKKEPTPKEQRAIISHSSKYIAETLKKIRELGTIDLSDPKVDEKKYHTFGVYGKIKCSEREILAAKALAVGVDIFVTAVATGIPYSELFAMYEGGGRQPDFPKMLAHYTAVYGILGNIKEIVGLTSEIKKAQGLPVNKKIDAINALVKLRSQILEALPPPPEKSSINFGIDATTIDIEKRVEELIKEFVKSIPWAGPGPKI